MHLLISVLAFLGPFILFFLELLFSSLLLPYFGGSSMVWISSTFAYTFLMLLGYVWVQFSARLLSLKKYVIVHFSLLILSLIHVIFSFDLSALSMSGSQNVFMSVLSYIGPCFFMLSMTTSLLQFITVNAKGSDKNVFNIFAISNVGSILSLLFFPLIFEFFLSYETNIIVVKALFTLYLILFIPFLFKKYEDHFETVDLKINIKTFGVWTLHSFTGVLLLLSVTNFISIGLGANSLLWSVPLIIYLFSFVLTFSKRKIVTDKLLNILIFTWLTVHISSLQLASVFSFLSSSAYYLFLLLSTIIVHRNLHALRPQKLSNVVSFNVAINIGGVIASAFVIFAIPYFTTVTGNIYAELFWAIIFYLVLLLYRDFKGFIKKIKTNSPFKNVGLFILILIIPSFIFLNRPKSENIFFKRNYYGLSRIILEDNLKVYINGRTNHGAQYVGSKSIFPLMYYHPSSPISPLLREIEPKDVTVIGLGVGSLASYATSGSNWNFIEIDPAVVKLAKEHFTFIKDSPGNIKIIEGDGRLKLFKIKEQDIIILDAFSSNSVPVHLLTIEAIAEYFEKLNSDGVLALHISNNFFDLADFLSFPILTFFKNAYVCEKSIEDDLGVTSSQWIFASNSKMIKNLKMIKSCEKIDKTTPQYYWQDNKRSVLRALIQ